MTAEPRPPSITRYLTRQPVMLTLLLGLAIVCFVAVSGLSRLYHAQQETLGNRWFARGVTDLNAGRFNVAVTEFRTALLYSRDNYAYELKLAEALKGMKKTDEAYAYLINLWERQPENGLVNLDLGRIAAAKSDTDHALRYYHNAIYAAWPGDEEKERRDARLELIDFLLRTGAKAQAQSELIALEANLGDDPAQQTLVGDLFLRAQDYEHALAAYSVSLKSNHLSSNHHNPTATAGAGLAAFELGRYSLAARYLEAAVAAAPSDADSAARLKTAELVLRMDPFRERISVAQRNRTVVEAFALAGERLKSCVASESAVAGATPQPVLAEEWTKMKPQITERSLRQDPDMVHSTMELVFKIERQTNGVCGAATDRDTALLLIAKLHEGS